jgi:hypothetical protein
MTTKLETGSVEPDAIERSLEFAGLPWESLRRGSHPDSGDDCLFLEGTIQQYSAFLVALAVQHRGAGRMSFLVDQVQLQTDNEGDTRFWMPGLTVRGI